MRSILERFYDSELWELKYRPQKVSDIILPTRIKNQFNTDKKKMDVGNLLLTGPKGSGKTTLASCIIQETNREFMYMNMSKDNSINDIREKVMIFVTNVGFFPGKKIIFGDEFDRLSVEAMDSLKALIEEFSSNVNFIFTSNHEYKITAEMKSRLTKIDFNFSQSESKRMKGEMWNTACTIAEKENIEYDRDIVKEVIKLHFPDMRKVLNKLQQLYKIHDKLTKDIVIESDSFKDIELLFDIIKKKDYTDIKKFVMNQSDFTHIYSSMFKVIDEHINKKNIGEAIVLIAKYQDQSKNSVDKQIQFSALCVELARII